MAATNLAKILSDGGTLVNYGAMAKEPILVPAPLLIFKNLRFVGFWMSRWYQESSEQDREEMVNGMAALCATGKLKFKFNKTPLTEEDHWKEAIKAASSGFIQAKQLLTFHSDPCS